MEGEVEIMLTEVQLEPRVAGELRWGGMERGERNSVWWVSAGGARPAVQEAWSPREGRGIGGA